MNPGIGAPELLVLAILALVVVGPKELPLLMRRIGRMVGQARGLAREFMRGFDELGREAELAELRKEIDALKRADPVADAKRQLESELDLDSLEREITEGEGPRRGVEAPHPRTAPRRDAEAPKHETAEPAQSTADEAEADPAPRRAEGG
jgi:sec-independent protein translocase protein TatB